MPRKTYEKAIKNRAIPNGADAVVAVTVVVAAVAVAAVAGVTEAEEAEAEVEVEVEAVVVAAEGKFLLLPRFLMVANMEQWKLNRWRRISTWVFRHFLLGCDGVFFGAIEAPEVMQVFSILIYHLSSAYLFCSLRNRQIHHYYYRCIWHRRSAWGKPNHLRECIWHHIYI